jgi:hypothetical protein
VERFVRAPAHRRRFPDEIELLTPIVEGAGILYVVDGSVPYGAEYEAEMEVLRWTGQPSFAVINPIGAADHIEAWRSALGQYFSVVRVFDPLDADVEKRLDLLRAFAALEDRFRAALGRAVDVLGADHEARRSRAAEEIAGLVAEATSLVVEKRIGRDERGEDHRAALEAQFRAELRRIERRARRAVEAVYDFHDLDVEEGDEVEGATDRALLEEDLFDRDTWLVFGLRGRDLVTAGAATGAAAGGTLDVALGGASFLAGAAIGSLVGGALGWLGSDRLGRLQVLSQPLGGALVRYGPARSPNFVAVLLGRACLHASLVARRAHARRDRLSIDGGAVAGEGDPAARAPATKDSLRRIEPARLRRVLEAIDGSEGPDRAALVRAIEPLMD